VLMRHEVGLACAPVGQIDQARKSFQSRIDLGLSPDGPWIDAKSIVKVMLPRRRKIRRSIFVQRGLMRRPRWKRS